ncbi:D-alanyl-D-alanine carboxypeptidase family protein [Paracoccus sp. (in: a-proteobacteria)]|uniref:D-alanyl-D-alanine carboxypeptidase family protein n=1 Tax=Paracoccus sp. TaxID=267 RepID=UPI0026DEAE5D|nr:D-alanyl-D-alanine carboxypeptidase family protein [Paracoccus sp. (in: a-proteobacteria)]MDO5646539.1 D-alanyl-D-alanine carboxypeptidase family protein [Paracoccus sp. (in: a-proteobacteria)]
MTRYLTAARLISLIFVVIPVLLAAQVQAAPFAAYVMDARTGQPIYRQNADTRLHPASLTKMMTLYMAFHAIESGRVRLDTKFTVSTKAANEAPSKLGLRPGQQIELRYLIRAAAIRSANDAATAIGEGLAGSEAAFAQQMTQMARALGMNNTQFQNAHGLTQSGHFSTAHDMSILGRHLFYDFPQYYNLFSRRSADAGVAQVASTNRRFLDDYAGADGIKTGYTRAAGFNLTASAQRGNKRVIATVFGGTSTAHRNQVIADLMDNSFQRMPDRVREVRPQRPRMMAQTVTRRAAVEPSPAVTQPQTQQMVLQTSAAPTRATRTAAPAQPTPSLTQALLQAGAQPAAPAQAATAAAPSLRLASSMRPRARPGQGQPAPQPAAVAEAPAPAASDAAVTASLAAPVLQRSARPVSRPGSAAPVQTAAAPAAPAATPAPQSASLSLVASTPPQPRSETVILAAMGEGDLGDPQQLEIVRRPADSGRNWGIVLGTYTTRAEADRLLVSLALQDGALLGNARRHVADTRRGFEPSFVRMSRGDAQLACDRMRSRAQECRVEGR